MAEKITEESGVHKTWKEEAKKVDTPEALAEFVRHLTKDYEHDYGTIVHAMTAAMLAAYHVVNESPQGGITGFQASCLGWSMVDKFFGKSETGRRLVNFDDLLYPQHRDKFTSIPRDVLIRIRQKAEKNLEEVQDAHPDVRAHWKKVAEGYVPFDLEVDRKEE